MPSLRITRCLITVQNYSAENNVLRRIPILGGILGGIVDVLSGFGNVVRGNFSTGLSQVANGLGRTMGHVWSFPNTLVGLTFGVLGMMFGAHPSWDRHIAILRFTNMPEWLLPTALSLGDVNVFGPQTSPDRENYFGVTLGKEESLHSAQSRILGPLYLPAHLIGGFRSWMTSPENARYPQFGVWHRNNFMENGPMTGKVF